MVTTSKEGEYWRLLNSPRAPLGKTTVRVRACSTRDNAVSDWVKVALNPEAVVRLDLTLKGTRSEEDEENFVCRIDYEALLIRDPEGENQVCLLGD